MVASGTSIHGAAEQLFQLPIVAGWKAKLEATRRRDTRTVRSLRRLGWSVLVLWECQLRHEGRLVQRIHDFIAP